MGRMGPAEKHWKNTGKHFTFCSTIPKKLFPSLMCFDAVFSKVFAQNTV